MSCMLPASCCCPAASSMQDRCAIPGASHSICRAGIDAGLFAPFPGAQKAARPGQAHGKAHVSSTRFIGLRESLCGVPDQVRAAVPMYLLSRKIKAGGFKVVLSGEGADEIYGGYLYFHKAPCPEEFQQCAPPPASCRLGGRSAYDLLEKQRPNMCLPPKPWPRLYLMHKGRGS